MPDGREIAVKRLLFSNRHRATDLCNEVNLISKVEHKNLVRLLGCCCSGLETLLIYEFLQNKSLDRFLFGIVYSLSFPPTPTINNKRLINSGFAFTQLGWVLKYDT